MPLIFPTALSNRGGTFVDKKTGSQFSALTTFCVDLDQCPVIDPVSGLPTNTIWRQSRFNYQINKFKAEDCSILQPQLSVSMKVTAYTGGAAEDIVADADLTAAQTFYFNLVGGRAQMFAACGAG